MYTLKEWWMLVNGAEPTEDWDGKIHCLETDAQKTSLTNQTQGFLACYTFTLITRGELTLTYNGREIRLRAGDLYIYSPGMAVTVNAISDDYRGFCLLADESATLETPEVRDMISLAYKPVMQLNEPKLTLPAETAASFEARMREIIAYLHSDHLYKQQILRMLYAVFLLDFHNIKEKVDAHGHIPHRMEEIFIGFSRLLPQQFVEHHDIGFYANELNITPDYLSRIVKRVSGRTVVDYVNQMLVMEAAFLLRTSQLSISQIADRLRFADLPSFSKFFSRLKGISPKEYRERKLGKPGRRIGRSQELAHSVSHPPKPPRHPHPEDTFGGE